MKKAAIIQVFIFAFTANFLLAQNPIPSWNVPLYFHANFQELNRANNYNLNKDRGKRVIHITAQRGSSGQSNCGTVWIYSINDYDIIGPFELCEGGSLCVDIDERDWGVLVESESHMVVNVWIDEVYKRSNFPRLINEKQL